MHRLLSKLSTAFFWAVFILMLGDFLYAMSIGWHQIIGTGSHGFRQTQTVLSAYFLSKDSPWLFYETPILGPPWSVPFEFPTYQWMVALLHQLTAYPLDESARLISVACFLGSLIFVWKLLALINFSKKERTIFLTLLLASSMYRFWSWAGMIESTALFLSIAFTYYAVISAQSSSWCKTLLACLVGILAILTKTTTFFAFHIGIAFYLFCLWWIRDHHRLNAQTLLHYTKQAFFLGAVPLLFAFSWAKKTDLLRAHNPLADFLLEKNLREWNFGTLEQKLNPETWRLILERALENSLGSFWFLVAACVIGIFSPHFFLLALILILLGVSAPLVFTNVYFVHDYYAYAISIFFIGAFALLIVGAMRHSRIGFIAGTLLFLGACFQNYETYNNGYMLGQLRTRGDLLEIRNLFDPRPNKDEVLLIWGYDWSSEIAYASKRRAIMDRLDRSMDDPAFKTALQTTTQPIGGAIFCDKSALDPVFIQERLDYFKLEPNFTQIAGCRYYLKP